MTRQSELRRTAIEICELARSRLDVRERVRGALPPLSGPTLLVSIGKAAAAMAQGVADRLGEIPPGSLIVSKDGDGLRHAGHPLPDERSLAVGAELEQLFASSDGTIILCVSGGASALACAPLPGLTLENKRQTIQALQRAGAPIAQVNRVRQCLSRIKGGRLLATTRARVVPLLVSDVIGDDPAIIGGGLASGSSAPPTVDEARAICARWGVPAPAQLAAPPAMAPTGEVVLGLDALAQAVGVACQERGFVLERVETGEHGPVEALATRLAATALALAWRAHPGEQLALVVGGEPTVALPARVGRGGRAQHVAALVAEELATMPWPDGRAGCVLALASDGSDGNGDAGGLVDAGSWARAGHQAAGWLAGFDSGQLLEAAGDLVHTGPTGQNLGDIYLVLAVGSPP